MASTDTTLAHEDAVLRLRCGLLDRSDRGRLALSGAGAAAFLNGQVTNDIESLGRGSGCYVGQETVARLYYRGKPNRFLRGLRLAAPADSGAELRFGDRIVGRLGSSVESPRLGPIGLALVRREVALGADVAVGEDGTSATVMELPFPR